MIIVDHYHITGVSVALSACLAINSFTTLATKRTTHASKVSRTGGCEPNCQQQLEKECAGAERILSSSGGAEAEEVVLLTVPNPG